MALPLQMPDPTFPACCHPALAQSEYEESVPTAKESGFQYVHLNLYHIFISSYYNEIYLFFLLLGTKIYPIA